MRVILTVRRGESFRFRGYSHGGCTILRVYDDGTCSVNAWTEAVYESQESTADTPPHIGLCRVSISDLFPMEVAVEMAAQEILRRLPVEQILEPDRMMRLDDILKLPVIEEDVDEVDDRLASTGLDLVLVGEITQDDAEEDLVGPDDEEQEGDEDDAARRFLIALIRHIRNDRAWYDAVTGAASDEEREALGITGRESFMDALAALREALEFEEDDERTDQ